jgi:hypothetical protein
LVYQLVIYGRDLSGNLSQLSNITPQSANVNSLIVKCSLVNNGVSNVSDIVDSFAISNGKFGENLNYNNNIENKIIGGVDAVPHSWPSIVALYRKDSTGWSKFCGGTLIDNKTVLTAAQ